MHKHRQWSAESATAELEIPMDITSAQKLCSGSFMDWVSMAGQLHASITSQSTTPNSGYYSYKEGPSTFVHIVYICVNTISRPLAIFWWWFSLFKFMLILKILSTLKNYSVDSHITQLDHEVYVGSVDIPPTGQAAINHGDTKPIRIPPQHLRSLEWVRNVQVTTSWLACCQICF